MKRIPVWILQFGIFLSVLLAIFFYLTWQRNLESRRKQLEIADQTFSSLQNFFRATKVTADPCSTVFYELLQSTGYGRSPALVVMGNVLLDRPEASYFLVSKGDRVELMKRAAPYMPAKKAGEKYNPDSKFCRERKTHVGTEF